MFHFVPDLKTAIIFKECIIWCMVEGREIEMRWPCNSPRKGTVNPSPNQFIICHVLITLFYYSLDIYDFFLDESSGWFKQNTWLSVSHERKVEVIDRKLPLLLELFRGTRGLSYIAITRYYTSLRKNILTGLPERWTCAIKKLATIIHIHFHSIFSSLHSSSSCFYSYYNAPNQ